MASEIRVNKIQNRSGLTTTTFSDTGVDIVGVATAFNFKTGTTNVHNVGVEAAGINVLGADTPIGTGATIYDDGGARFSGIVSATSFVGSGANLTGITETTINNNADNRIITGSGTANTLEGEANLTFSSNQLTVHEAKLKGNQLLFTTSGTAYLDHSTVGQDIQVRVSTSSSQDTTGPTFKSNGNLAFASGKGIDFSATGGPAEGSGTSELFHDYEEGTFTPVWKFDPTNATSVTYNIQNGKYVKIGGVVFIRIELQVSNKGSLPSGAGWAQIDGLPYACSEYSAVSIGIYQHFNNVQPGIAHVGTSEQVYIAYDPSLSSNTSSYDLQHTNFTNNSRINISGTYYAV